MLTELINQINITSMESSINVCNAITDLIDKDEIIKEYDEWLEQINIENDFTVDDNPMVFLTFLQERGLLKDKEDE